MWEDECEIECPKHGSTFSLRTGEPQTLPATRPVPLYEIALDGDDVDVVTPMNAERAFDRGPPCEGRGHEIFRGVDLEVRSGEVHVVMGPNGSGKSTLSHTLMGRGDYEVTRGHVTIDGTDLLLAAHVATRTTRACSSRCSTRSRCRACRSRTGRRRRARRHRPLGRGCATRPSARRAHRVVDRGVNDEFSGGEKKRAETVQLAVLQAEVRGTRRDRLRSRRRRAPRRVAACRR